MTDIIYKLMVEACLQNKESWVTLYLNNGEKLIGQIVDYNNDRILLPINEEYQKDEDVIVIPMSRIKYFACGESLFNLKLKRWCQKII